MQRYAPVSVHTCIWYTDLECTSDKSTRVTLGTGLHARIAPIGAHAYVYTQA